MWIHIHAREHLGQNVRDVPVLTDLPLGSGRFQGQVVRGDITFGGRDQPVAASPARYGRRRSIPQHWGRVDEASQASSRRSGTTGGDFLVAAAIHLGLLFPGYGHRAAGTAESIIAVVLIVGLVVTLASPSRARVAAIAVQSFGILGVVVGLITIAVGIGPRTSLDLALHGLMLIVLVAGLIIAVQMKTRAVTA